MYVLMPPGSTNTSWGKDSKLNPEFPNASFTKIAISSGLIVFTYFGFKQTNHTFQLSL